MLVATLTVRISLKHRAFLARKVNEGDASCVTFKISYYHVLGSELTNQLSRRTCTRIIILRNKTAVIMECSLCRTRLPSLASYISHLRLVHANDRSFNITCGISNCSSIFKSFGGFNTHVYRHHRDALGLEKSTDHDLGNSSTANSDYPSNIVDPPLSPPTGDYSSFQVSDLSRDDATDQYLPEPINQEIMYDVWHLLGISQEQQKRTAAAFLLKLREVCRVSEKSIGDIIDGTTQLFNQAFMVSKAEISDVLSCSGVNASSMENMQSIQLPNPFAELETIYKQDKYFKEGFNYLVINKKMHTPQYNLHIKMHIMYPSLIV